MNFWAVSRLLPNLTGLSPLVPVLRPRTRFPQRGRRVLGHRFGRLPLLRSGMTCPESTIFSPGIRHYQCRADNYHKRNVPACGLTSFVMDLTLRIMGDKSPKAAHKHAAQKQEKAKAANQKKNIAASAKQVPKPKQ